MSLAGICVVLTRPEGQNEGLAAEIRKRGGDAIVFPVLAIADIDDSSALRDVAGRLDSYDMAIFISPNATHRAMRFIHAEGRSWPSDLAAATVGPASAAVLRDYGVRNVSVPEGRYDSESLLGLPALQDVNGKRIVIFRGEGGRPLLGDTLAARGAHIDYAACYRRIMPQVDSGPLRQAGAAGRIDAIVVTSSEGLRNLHRMLGPDALSWLLHTPLLLPHARIADQARALGHSAIILTPPGDEGLLSALDGFSVRVRESPNNEIMTDPSIDPPPGVTPVPAAKQRERRRAGNSSIALVLCGLAILAAAAGWYDMRRQLNQTREQIARQVRDVSAEARDARLISQATQEAVREMQAKVGALDAKQAEAQSQQVALETLYQELSRNRDDWVLAEIEQTLTIASQQLQLAGNVQAALLALQSVDARLARSDRPQLLALRKAVARDIEKLRAAPNVDVTGMTLRVDQVIAQADSLPLLIDARAKEDAPAVAQTDAPWWRRWPQGAWQELRQLVRVQRLDAVDQKLLSPEQRYFARENLKLRLLHGRIALLQRDQNAFRADMKAAEQILRGYFDPREKAVVTAAGTVAQLHEAAVNVDLPTISDSLAAIQNLKLPRERVR
ncbi:MAG TPA: fused uroporphyrinogen-III synthase HemD/membrane protein HemX [Burkholderiales bacterium]|nr:fused uroporphyrinogen-III synthase HemD/membrane protein HemX [Burkholderiales bacterium]